MSWMRVDGAEPLTAIGTGRLGGIQIRFGSSCHGRSEGNDVRADAPREGRSFRVKEATTKRMRCDSNSEHTMEGGRRALLEDLPGVFDHVPQSLLRECDEPVPQFIGNCATSFPERWMRTKGEIDKHILIRTTGTWDETCTMEVLDLSPDALVRGKELMEVGRVQTGFPVRLLSCSRPPGLVACNSLGDVQCNVSETHAFRPPLVAAVGMYDACVMRPQYSGDCHKWSLERMAMGQVSNRPISDFAWSPFIHGHSVAVTEGGGMFEMNIELSDGGMYCTQLRGDEDLVSSTAVGSTNHDCVRKCIWGNTPTSTIHAVQSKVTKVDLRQPLTSLPLYEVKQGSFLGLQDLWTVWDEIFTTNRLAERVHLCSFLGDLSSLFAASTNNCLYLIDERYPGQSVLCWERTKQNKDPDMLVPFVCCPFQDNATCFDVSIGLSSAKSSSMNCFPFKLSLGGRDRKDVFSMLHAGYDALGCGLPFEVAHIQHQNTELSGLVVAHVDHSHSSTNDFALYTFSTQTKGQYCMQENLLEPSDFTVNARAQKSKQEKIVPSQCLTSSRSRRQVYLPTLSDVLFRDIGTGKGERLPGNLRDQLQSELGKALHPMTEQDLGSRIFARQSTELSSMRFTEVPWFPLKKLFGHKNCSCSICTRLSEKRAAAAEKTFNKPILHVEDAIDYFRSKTSYAQEVVRESLRVECLVLERSSTQELDVHDREESEDRLVLFHQRTSDMMSSWMDPPEGCTGRPLALRRRLLNDFFRDG